MLSIISSRLKCLNNKHKHYLFLPNMLDLYPIFGLMYILFLSLTEYLTGLALYSLYLITYTLPRMFVYYSISYMLCISYFMV
jgi:hypothetical protein